MSMNSVSSAPSAFEEKPLLIARFSKGNLKNLLLVADDKLLTYEGNYEDIDVLNLDPLQWGSIQVQI
jgi:hypothetical protein